MLESRPLKTICCVLKSGGDFEPKHVEWLRKQCAEKMPGWDFKCWSDMDVSDAIPLTHHWPKWWSKFEIYGYQFDGPSLVIDLDTVFVDELKIKPEHEDKAIFLRNPWKDGFRYPEQIAGGFSYLPQWARHRLWSEFIERPQQIMALWCGDDQPFLHSLFASEALRWQDHYIDEVVSYKAQTKRLGITPDNKVIVFHGVPRPWEVEEPWLPRLNVNANRHSQE